MLFKSKRFSLTNRNKKADKYFDLVLKLMRDMPAGILHINKWPEGTVNDFKIDAYDVLKRRGLIEQRGDKDWGNLQLTEPGWQFIGFVNEKKKLKRDANPTWYSFKLGVITGLITLSAGVSLWLIQRRITNLERKQQEFDFQNLKKKVDSLTNNQIYLQKKFDSLP